MAICPVTSNASPTINYQPNHIQISTVCLPVNGGWSVWSSWSACNTSVARDLSQRQRSCTNPAPSALGHNCAGDSTDKRLCPGNLRSIVIISLLDISNDEKEGSPTQ